jgi:hypothetical protein
LYPGHPSLRVTHYSVAIRAFASHNAAVRHLRRAALILIPSMLVLYAIMAYQLRKHIVDGYSDFISAYTAAKILQRGEPHRLYDLQLQSQIQRDVAPNVSSRGGALPFVRPPFEAWLFYPLARFSYHTAFCVWTIASCAFLFIAMALLRRHNRLLQSFPLLMVTLAALSFFPVFMTLLQGQDSILLLLIYVLSYTALVRGSVMGAGAILALGLFKFPLVLPFLLVFILRGKARFLAGFIVVAGVLILLSIGMVGLAGIGGYIHYLASIDALAPGVNISRDMPNLRGLLALVDGPGLSLLSTSILIVASAVVLGIVAAVWTNPDGDADLPAKVSLNVLATILVSYHAHVFDLALLIIPICVGLELLLYGQLDRRSRVLLAWSTGLAAFSPLYVILVFSLRGAPVLAVLVLGVGVALSRTIRPKMNPA